MTLQTPETTADHLARSIQNLPNDPGPCQNRWQTYHIFCQQQGYPSVPATMDSITAFLSHLVSHNRSRQTIRGYLWAITRMHQAQGFELSRRLSDLGLGAMEMTRHKSRQIPRIAASDLYHTLGQLDDTLAGKRAKALFLIHFLSGCRGTDILSLRFGQIKFRDNGIRLSFPPARQSANGNAQYMFLSSPADPTYCLKATLSDWYKSAALQAGYVFRGLQNNGRYPLETALTLRSYNRLIKQHFGPAYSSHSFRDASFGSAPVTENIREAVSNGSA